MKHFIQSEIGLINARRKEINYLNTITLNQKIKERIFTIKDIGVNYRWLDHWSSKGLLLNSYNKHKWKKFNLIEFVWIRVILKIREFNMSLKTVSAVKELLEYEFTVENLVKNPDVNFNEVITQFATSEHSQAVRKLLIEPEIKRNIEEMRFNFLEVMITDILLLGNCYSIIINPDGEIIPVKYSFIELISDIPEFINIINRSFVSISITEILRDYIIDKELVHSYKKRLALLTEEEAIVLNTIRQDDLKSVIIKFDANNKLNFLEEVKESKVDKAARLAELIMSKGYQDITIKTQNGSIVYCENKKKTMIHNKD
jgi:DNA-binding transcriptional MerR regulator